MKLGRMAAVCVGTVMAAATATAQVNYSGTWNTNSGAAGGRGAGRIVMSATHRNGGVTFRYGGNTMTCSLAGSHCGGSWQGGTGSGWFEIDFTPDGGAFSGTWGYGNDRANAGSFTGSR